jgi:hypothetical protein
VPCHRMSFLDVAPRDRASKRRRAAVAVSVLSSRPTIPDVRPISAYAGVANNKPRPRPDFVRAYVNVIVSGPCVRPVSAPFPDFVRKSNLRNVSYLRAMSYLCPVLSVEWPGK